MHSLDSARAPQIVTRIGDVRVLVVGDVMLDHFVIGRVNRISPEAPVPVVEFHGNEFRLGGAANVAHNVRTLGGNVDIVGLIGADGDGERLSHVLAALGVDTGGLVTDEQRCTTKKMRVVTTRNQQVARVDYESEAEITGELEEKLAERAERAARSARAIVVADYLKGAITKTVMSRLVASAASNGIPLVVDPKIPHINYYAGATLITPNQLEAETATHIRIRTPADVQAAARALQRLAVCDSVLITRGEQGMWLLDGSRAAPPGDGPPIVNHEENFPAMAREVADVTGAGDTVAATIALCLATGAGLADAARVANYAAGVVVAKFGPATVTPAELMAAIQRGSA